MISSRAYTIFITNIKVDQRISLEWDIIESSVEYILIQFSNNTKH